MADNDGFTTVSHKKSHSQGKVTKNRSGSISPTRKHSPRPRCLSDPIVLTGTPGVGRRGAYLVIGSAVNQLNSQDSLTESEGGGSTQESTPEENPTESISSYMDSTKSYNKDDPVMQNSIRFAFGEISPEELSISPTNSTTTPDVEMKDMATPSMPSQAGPSLFTQDDLTNIVPSTGKGKGRAPQPSHDETTPPSSEDEDERNERQQHNKVADRLGAQTAQQLAQSVTLPNEFASLNSSIQPNDLMRMFSQFIRDTMALERKDSIPRRKRKNYEPEEDSYSSTSSSDSEDSPTSSHRPNVKPKPRKKSKKSSSSQPTHISEPRHRRPGSEKPRDIPSLSRRAPRNPSMGNEQINLALRRGFSRKSNPNLIPWLTGVGFTTSHITIGDQTFAVPRLSSIARVVPWFTFVQNSDGSAIIFTGSAAEHYLERSRNDLPFTLPPSWSRVVRATKCG
ncbi:hypothetical protein DL96DRAFT_1720586 [Flagelloscypha sp. PMI_526]|nr:hypothetical protein DL96DRAFT_1720586 [Flagelloscypha sp. PMI_526]